MLPRSKLLVRQGQVRQSLEYAWELLLDFSVRGYADVWYECDQDSGLSQSLVFKQKSILESKFYKICLTNFEWQFPLVYLVHSALQPHRILFWARAQPPSLPLNFLCSAITFHALTCCLLPDGCNNQLMSFASFISALKRHKVLENKERKMSWLP